MTVKLRGGLNWFGSLISTCELGGAVLPDANDFIECVGFFIDHDLRFAADNLDGTDNPGGAVGIVIEEFDILAEHRIGFHEILLILERADACAHGFVAFERAELRHLRDEIAVLLRIHRVLTRELCDEQFNEILLPERLHRNPTGIRRRGV